MEIKLDNVRMNAAFINNARLLLKGLGIVSAFKICAIYHWQGFDLIHSTGKSYFSSEQKRSTF